MSLNLRKRNNSQTKRLYTPNIISQINYNLKLNYEKYLNNFQNNIISNKNTPNPKALTPNHYESKKFFLLKEINMLPPKSPEFLNKKTLILDLDETLVHSSFVPFPKSDIILNVNFDGIPYKIYVLVRPGAEDFIKNLSNYFELVIFTASLSKYASPLLDILDKEKHIQYRLYRENCTLLNGIYIKSLKKIGRNMKDLIIVDNSPLAYAFDRDNGLPISSWFEDKNDKELYNIIPLLIFLSKTNDVRKFIEKFVSFDKIDYSNAYKIIDQEENIEKTFIQNKINKEQNNIHENKSNSKIKNEDKKVSKYEDLTDNIFNKNNKNILNFNNINSLKKQDILSSKKNDNIPFLINNNIISFKPIEEKTKLYQNININNLEIINNKNNKNDNTNINKNKNKDEKKLNSVMNKQNNLTSNNDTKEKKNIHLFLNLTQRNLKDTIITKNKKKLSLTKGLTISNTCKNIFTNKKKSNKYNFLISNFNLYKNSKNQSNVNIFNNNIKILNSNKNKYNNNLKTLNQKSLNLKCPDLLYQYNNNNKLQNKKTNNIYTSFRNKAIIFKNCKPKLKKRISSSVTTKEIINAKKRVKQIFNKNFKSRSSASYNVKKKNKINTEFNMNNAPKKIKNFSNNKTFNNI